MRKTKMIYIVTTNQWPGQIVDIYEDMADAFKELDKGNRQIHNRELVLKGGEAKVQGPEAQDPEDTP